MNHTMCPDYLLHNPYYMDNYDMTLTMYYIKYCDKNIPQSLMYDNITRKPTNVYDNFRRLWYSYYNDPSPI